MSKRNTCHTWVYFFNIGLYDPITKTAECLYKKCGDILASTQRLVTHLESKHNIYREDYFNDCLELMNKGRGGEQPNFDREACQKAIVVLVATQNTTIEGACSTALQNLIFAIEGGTNYSTTKFLLPTGKTVRKWLGIYHNKEKDLIIKTLSKFSSFGISVDSWSGNYNHPVFGIKVTYIDKAKLKSYTIGFEHLYSNHTGDYFAEVL